MDELTLIRGFGLAQRAASPSEREEVRAGLLAHVERGSRTRVGQRRWVIALATVLLLLLAGTALALGPLRGLFEGEPAPPKVKHSIAGFNDFHEQLLRMGLGGFVVRSEDATGLIRFHVGKLPVRVWTAPLVDGGSCTFVETPGERFLQIGPCVAEVNVQPPVLFGLSQHVGFDLVAGHVTDRVARLDVLLGSGRVRHLRLVNGFFATGFASGNAFTARENREVDALVAHQQRETRRHALPPQKLEAHQAAEWTALKRRQAARRAAVRPGALTAYDAGGGRITSVALPGVASGLTFAPAFFYQGMRALLQINTLSGAPAGLMLHERDDRNCEAIWIAGGGGTSSCGEGWMRSSGSGRRWILSGDAGQDAASAEIQYGDGERHSLDLLESRFLVELSDEQLAGMPKLVVQDASGKIIRTRVLARPEQP